MKLDRFINRPVLSTVISIVVVILGILGLVSLPVSQYPDIAPPTIRVTTTYTGANAQTILNSVIAPLEEQINGVEDMMYMSSTATNTGEASIEVYFKQGTDPDMAAVNVQNRVAKAQGFLPAEVTQVGVITQKRQSSMLLGFSFYSSDDKYDNEFLENYMNINIIPEIKRIQGVGDAMVMGTDYSMRIWLKPDVMAQYKLMPSDVSVALAEQNIEAAPGQFGERGNQSFQYVMKYKGRLQTQEEFENIVIRATSDGEIFSGIYLLAGFSFHLDPGHSNPCCADRYFLRSVPDRFQCQSANLMCHGIGHCHCCRRCHCRRRGGSCQARPRV